MRSVPQTSSDSRRPFWAFTLRKTTHEFCGEREARTERLSLAEAIKPLLEKLNRGERLSVEERTASEQQMTRMAELDKEITHAEQMRALSAAQVPGVPEGRDELTDVERREQDFSAWLKRGTVSPELRAAGEATNSAGGYLVPPGWWQRLQVAMKAFGGTAEDFETIETESGQPMQWATVDPTTTIGQLVGSANTTGANAQTPGQGSGGGTANENQAIGDLDFVFGQGTLGAYMYTSGAQKISFQLANDSAFDTDAFVSARVAEALGRAQALAAISGSGTNQPLGIVPALGAKSSAGTSGGTIAGTGGFVTLAAAAAVKNFAGSTTELAANTLNPTTLLSMIAAVDPAYRALGAKWYFNDNQLLGTRQLVDANGRPLLNLQDGLSQGAVGTLFGYPVVVDQQIPNLTLSTTGGPIFGHLGSAMVRRVVNQSGLLRLDQRWADLFQIGYVGYMRFDIRSNDLRAAVTVKAAAT